MRLGARWRVGERPHSSVPSALDDEIARQETMHPDANSWTLTWLERRPRAALDDLVLVTVNAEGQVVASSGGSGAAILGPDTLDDDDDWLS